MAEGLLAVDIGTGRVKVGVVGLDGELIAFAHRGYGLIDGGQPGWVEQDAAVWWSETRDAIRAAVASSRGTTIVAACIGGQGPSIVPVDERGEPLAHAIIWMDRRAEPERERISARLGQEVSPYSAIPKAAWIREHQPEVYARTRWFLQSWDFIAFRLTSVAVSSSFRGATVFPPEVLAAADLDPSRFPREILMGECGGTLRPDVARDLGLPAGIPVAGGVNDSTATVLGAGVLRKGHALDLGGTSGGLALIWDAPLRENGLTAWPAPAPGLFVCGGPLAAAGRSLPWFMSAAGYAPGEYTTVEHDAAAAPPGADGLVFLPYLAGERTPVWDDRARGVLFGLTERHTRGHLARAVLEGVAFSLRHVADVLRASGGAIEELRVTGGQAHVMLWNRIKADVIGAPVVVPTVTEGALLGEAILAAAGAGRTPDALTASASLVRVAARLEPDPATSRVYDAAYATYRELYPRLRDLMRAEP
ncbi:MAG TPA: FGGY-family carbohydrate kinase [Candidatus Limnocylindria bacterium]|jgi:xylulokinase